jgi:hypothetical protein
LTRFGEPENQFSKRRQKIKYAWAEQKVIRTIMVFLHSNGIGIPHDSIIRARAGRLVKGLLPRSF